MRDPENLSCLISSGYVCELIRGRQSSCNCDGEKDREREERKLKGTKSGD